jgi:hypothetical protein
VEAEPERRLAGPPATWQEHWFDHRQLLRLYHSDEHCAIYVDPEVAPPGAVTTLALVPRGMPTGVRLATQDPTADRASLRASEPAVPTPMQASCAWEGPRRRCSPSATQTATTC